MYAANPSLCAYDLDLGSDTPRQRHSTPRSDPTFRFESEWRTRRLATSAVLTVNVNSMASSLF
jgi:hypothetical protein